MIQTGSCKYQREMIFMQQQQVSKELQQVLHFYIWLVEKETPSCMPPFIDQNQRAWPNDWRFWRSRLICLYKFHFSKSQLTNWLF